MKERGIRRTVSGWQVYVRVRGEFRSKHFPPDADLVDMRQWRDDQKQRAALRPKTPTPGTLAADVAAYLKARATMRSIKDRTLHLEQWRDALGPHRTRASVTPLDVRRVLEDWKAAGMSHPSLNRRRTALMSFYTVTDPEGANPARLVPRLREAVTPLRLPSRDTILKVIARIGTDKNRKSAAPVLKGRKTRARLLVLAWTGWPAAQLMRLKRQDVHWREKTALLRGRRKGSGSRDVILPLLPKAISALRDLDRVDGWGAFSTSALHKSVTRACKALGLPPFNPYKLRHRFLSDIASLTKDDRVVAELGMHTSPAQTRRYTEATVDRRLTDALTLAAKRL